MVSLGTGHRLEATTNLYVFLAILIAKVEVSVSVDVSSKVTDEADLAVEGMAISLQIT